MRARLNPSNPAIAPARTAAAELSVPVFGSAGCTGCSGTSGVGSFGTSGVGGTIGVGGLYGVGGVGGTGVGGVWNVLFPLPLYSYAISLQLPVSPDSYLERLQESVGLALLVELELLVPSHQRNHSVLRCCWRSW